MVRFPSVIDSVRSKVAFLREKAGPGASRQQGMIVLGSTFCYSVLTPGITQALTGVDRWLTPTQAAETIGAIGLVSFIPVYGLTPLGHYLQKGGSALRRRVGQAGSVGLETVYTILATELLGKIFRWNPAEVLRTGLSQGPSKAIPLSTIYRRWGDLPTTATEIRQLAMLAMQTELAVTNAVHSAGEAAGLPGWLKIILFNLAVEGAVEMLPAEREEDLPTLLRPRVSPIKEWERNRAFGARRISDSLASPYRGLSDYRTPSSFNIATNESVEALGRRWRERDRTAVREAVGRGLRFTRQPFFVYRALHRSRIERLRTGESSEAVPYLLREGEKVSLVKHFTETLSVRAFGAGVVLRDQVTALLHYGRALDRLWAELREESLPVLDGQVRARVRAVQPRLVGRDFLVREFLPPAQLQPTARDYEIVDAVAERLAVEAAKLPPGEPELEMIASLLRKSLDLYRKDRTLGWNIGMTDVQTPSGPVKEIVIFDPV